MIAQIIINSNARALNRIFDYIVPIELEEKIKIGSRILVPFGNSKKLEDGFVIGLKQTSEFANKNIEKILEDNYLTEDKVILAKLMAKKAKPRTRVKRLINNSDPLSFLLANKVEVSPLIIPEVFSAFPACNKTNIINISEITNKIISNTFITNPPNNDYYHTI